MARFRRRELEVEAVKREFDDGTGLYDVTEPSGAKYSSGAAAFEADFVPVSGVPEEDEAAGWREVCACDVGELGEEWGHVVCWRCEQTVVKVVDDGVGPELVRSWAAAPVAPAVTETGDDR